MSDFTFYGSVTIGERGQIVIPAVAREQLGLAPGCKIMVFKSPLKGALVITKVDTVEKHIHDMSKKFAAAKAQSLDQPGDKNE